MKNVLRLFLLLPTVFLMSYTVFGQWTDDPANPLAICALTGSQAQPVIINDNEEGFYVFWLDGRGGHTAAYGQHLNKHGNALWADNGIALVSYDSSDVSALHAVLNDEGNIMLAWQHYLSGSYPDTLYTQKFASDGSAIWSEPVAVAGNDLSDGGSFWGPVNFTLMKTDGGCFFAVQTSGYGYDFLLINKILNDGSLPWNYNGIIFPGFVPAGELAMLPDGEGGAFLSWNHYNSYLQRFSSDGELLWPSAVVVNACTLGTGGTYAGFPYFLMEPNNSGGIMTAWSSYSDDIYAASVDSGGVFSWADSCAAIYTDAYSQEEISFAKAGDAYYVAWIDSRPDAAGIYMQKFNEDGETEWAEELYIEDGSFYIPVLKSVATSEGDVTVFYQANGAFYCQKVHPDGTTEWTEPKEVSDGAHTPFYQNYNLVTSAEGDVIGVTQSGLVAGDENIYAFSLDYISGDTIHEDTTGTDGIIEIIEQPTVYPDPASDFISVELPLQSSFVSLNLLNAAGEIVLSNNLTSAYAQKYTLDIHSMKSGIYFLHICTDRSTWVKKIIIG